MATTLRIDRAAWAIALVVSLGLFSQTVRCQSPEDSLQSLVGQKFFLRSIGDQKHAKVKKDKLADLQGTCDIAIEVKNASWEKGRARLLLENIGSPSGLKTARRCGAWADDVTLEVSGFAADESHDSLVASLAQILPTPEQYMAS